MPSSHRMSCQLLRRPGKTAGRTLDMATACSHPHKRVAVLPHKAGLCATLWGTL